MGRHLVIVGAGHAHLTVLKNLNQFINSGHDVTVVNSSSLHYYSGMGPGMLSGIYRPEEIRFNVKKMTEDRGAVFVEDRVVKIRLQERKIELQSGSQISYDVISYNTGSFVPVDEAMLADPAVVPVKPIENLLKARHNIIDWLKQRELKIIVAGGGPAGVEVAGNLDRLIRKEGGRGRITLVTGTRLLPHFKKSVRRRALASFSRRAVQVVEGARLVKTRDGSVELSDGRILESDVVFMAVGVKPSLLFENAGLPTDRDGGMLVNHYLQSTSYPEIFGGGDCIGFEPQSLAKVGVYAVRQNPILLNNLLNTLKGESLQQFVPQRSFLLAFNMGDGTAIVQWHSLVWGGKLGFALKNYIDRKFMRNFQVSGELD